MQIWLSVTFILLAIFLAVFEYLVTQKGFRNRMNSKEFELYLANNLIVGQGGSWY